MQFTDEQRLIVIMLAEIQKTLGVKSEFNADFIKAASSDDNEFAIAFEYQGIFTAGNEPADFHFVLDVLEMWSVLEEAVESLDEYGQSVLQAAIGHRATPLKFDGFDGNQEFGLLNHARLLIKVMRRFDEFRARDLNSHTKRRDRYASMLQEFNEIQGEIDGQREMNPGEIGRVLGVKYVRE
ncbi:hypothetical protein BIZ42_16240 [Stenotrophomonas sp. LM091]|uniref:YfbU family protein n=1 Tax=Stenotrophomonas sp. LM091 TaxID=1904944 RepID=UPI00089E021C|nr:YfbU family protein [Stenotrophomonas sp. LM091]AOX63607.1 hypothetical protein BIZ42_16240 [Stenotrophomonas sp. LM091]